MKTCGNCRRDYQASSKHKNCPKCRRQLAKINCNRCGRKKQRESKTCSRCRPTGEKENPNWRGGRYYKAGYVMVYAPEHPRAVRTKHIFEHILVMETTLGRSLLANETVHHLNGIKDDNRPENLELWSRNHPAGQRARDLVIWARNILDLYGDGKFDT